MDLLGTVNCAELTAVLDAAAGLTEADHGGEALHDLVVALARLVGVDVALAACRAFLVEAPADDSTQQLDSEYQFETTQLSQACPEESAKPTDLHRDAVLRLLAPHLEEAFRRATRHGPELTPRERQVLLLVRDGCSNASIARALGVAESTVVKHLEHVYARVGAHSRTQAVRMCEAALD
jgi:DNA-binding CsgD family transcriptional regulator